MGNRESKTLDNNQQSNIIQNKYENEKGRLFSQEEGKTIYFETYEQACEAAIKYCLENLI